MLPEHKQGTSGARPRDRRIDLDKRKFVAEMSLEEMRLQLLTSSVTGLPNRRAFEEAGPAPFVAISDLDGLKALNGYGYAVGDAVLRAKADALHDAGLEAYHDKGDEFLCRANDPEDLLTRLERARRILAKRTIQTEQGDETAVQVFGADFSYGIGHNMREAEQRLRNQKAEREARGELARGRLCHISVRKTEQSEAVPAVCPSQTVTSVTV
ncbi:MAG TPA: hypothetical protein VKV39_00870 [Candidatus Sulfotelmatobacter sp.]|nr:hypothetical protein [Candidatus Sulfotelmatobacter sp.]